MEPGINDNEPRSAQAIYLSVEEKFEALQDEVNLLKIEIKQTLVDLREFLLNGQNRFSRFGTEAQSQQNSPGANTTQTPPSASQPPDSGAPAERDAPPTAQGNSPRPSAPMPDGAPPVPPAVHNPGPNTGPGAAPRDIAAYPAYPEIPSRPARRENPRAPRPSPHDYPRAPVSGNRETGLPYQVPADESERPAMWDVEMLGQILSWLSSVKDKGLSPQQLAPYLQAYQLMGYISPVMAKLIHRSIASLDQLDQDFNRNAMSSSDFLECLRQLHDIICTPGYR